MVLKPIFNPMDLFCKNFIYIQFPNMIGFRINRLNISDHSMGFLNANEYWKITVASHTKKGLEILGTNKGNTLYFKRKNNELIDRLGKCVVDFFHHKPKEFLNSRDHSLGTISKEKISSNCSTSSITAFQVSEMIPIISISFKFIVRKCLRKPLLLRFLVRKI